MINKQIREFPITYVGVSGRVAIGWGAHETVANECKGLNIKKALIVTSGLKGTGIVDEINHILTTQGVATEIYDKVTSNPKDHEVMEAYKIFKDTECDGLVSIGGGSSHDCAKGVRVVFANDGQDINKFAAFLEPPWMEEIKKYKPCTIPQVSINTTAGTGAEVSPFATITNTKDRFKGLIIVPNITPNVGIVDPLLIRLMPANIAAWTGFDALTHGIEAYVTRLQVPHSSGVLLLCIKYVAQNIREFTYNRMNYEACEKMCWAESMGGIGIGMGAGAGIVHGCGHVISALTGCHHGLINAVLMIPGERFNEVACPDRFADIARAMGVDTTGMTKMQAADKFFDEIERLLADLNIKTGHLNEQFGLQQKDLKHIATVFQNDFCREGNPRDCTIEETVKLLESCT